MVTQEEIKHAQEIQNAQDMLTATVNQRNSFANECVHLAAQIAARDRRISELESKVRDLDVPTPKSAIGLPPLRDWSNGNGHDTEAIQ